MQERGADLGEECFLRPQRVVGGEVDVVGCLEYCWVGKEAIALGGAAVDLDETEARREALDLVRPVLQHRQRGHDQVRTRQPLGLQSGEEGQSLHSLAEAHLVAEDAASAEAIPVGNRATLPSPLGSSALEGRSRGGRGGRGGGTAGRCRAQSGWRARTA